MKTVFVRKTFATMNANVRSLPRVHPRVRRKVMLEEEGLPAFRTGIRPFFRDSYLTSHILLLFHLCFYLRGINMRQHMSKMSRAVRLTCYHVVRVGLIRGSRRSLH